MHSHVCMNYTALIELYQMESRTFEEWIVCYCRYAGTVGTGSDRVHFLITLVIIKRQQ